MTSSSSWVFATVYCSYTGLCFAVGALCEHKQLPWGLALASVGSYLSTKTIAEALCIANGNMDKGLPHKIGFVAAAQMVKYSVLGFGALWLSRLLLKK